jgi:predicted outer membrane repeat protein
MKTGGIRLGTLATNGGAALTVLLFAVTAGATQLTVNNDTNGNRVFPDNLNDDGKCSLREAVQASNTGAPVHPHAGGQPDCAAGSGNDVIVLPAGQFALNGPPIDVIGTASIQGAGVDASIINANLLNDHTIGSYGKLTFSQAALVAGRTHFTAGFYVSPQATLNLIDSRVAGFTNSGVYILAGLAEVKFSTIEFNASAGDGGGINLDSDLDLGLLGALRMTGSTVRGNYAAEDGGGLAWRGTSSVIESSTFDDNQATHGGAIFAAENINDYLQVFHSTVTNNFAAVSGGGVSDAAGTASIRSMSTIWADNQAPLGPDVQGTFFIQESLISVLDGAYTGARVCTNVVPTVLGPAGRIDPRLGAITRMEGPHKTWFRLPLANSPVVDFDPGNLDGCPDSPWVDQRELPRPVNGGTGRAWFDIGAIELQSNETLMGFDTTSSWSSPQASLSLSSSRKTQGAFGLSVGGSGYRVVNSTALRTPLLPLTSNLRLDVFVPGSQPNPQWFGAVQLYATCASANLFSAFVGQADLTSKNVTTRSKPSTSS